MSNDELADIILEKPKAEIALAPDLGTIVMLDHVGIRVDRVAVDHTDGGEPVLMLELRVASVNHEQ